MFWGVVLSIIFLIPATIDGCHPRSRRLHVCLNMYLEKDLSDLETLIFPPPSRRGLPIIEDNQMQDICNQSMVLASCYAALFPECDTGWQLDRYSRLLILFNDTIYYVCQNRAENLKELLYKADCVISGKACHDFNWYDAWKSILRLSAEPTDLCPAIHPRPHSQNNALHAVSTVKMLLCMWSPHRQNVALHICKRSSHRQNVALHVCMRSPHRQNVALNAVSTQSKSCAACLRVGLRFSSRNSPVDDNWSYNHTYVDILRHVSETQIM